VSINGARALKRAYVVPMMLIGERGRRLYPLSPADIEYVQSDGNYVKYVSAGAEYVARELMKDLNQWLRPWAFLRIPAVRVVVSAGAVIWKPLPTPAM